MIEVHIKYPEVIYRYKCSAHVRYCEFPNEYIISILKDGCKISFSGLERSNCNIKTFTKDDISNFIEYVYTVEILNLDKIRYSINDIEFRTMMIEENVFT